MMFKNRNEMNNFVFIYFDSATANQLSYFLYIDYFLVKFQQSGSGTSTEVRDQVVENHIISTHLESKTDKCIYHLS